MGIFDNYFDSFPSEIQDSGGQDWVDLGAFMDQLDASLIEAIQGMAYFWDIERVPAFMLPFLSYAFRAGIYKSDSDRVKRRRIRDAIIRHQNKGTRTNVFELIEEITGVTPTIYVDEYSWFAIWESKNELMPWPNNFMKWDSKLAYVGGGFSWTSKSETSVLGAALRGYIYINLNVYPLSQRTIDKIVDVVEYFGAVYFRYYIGASSPEGWQQYRQIY